MISSAEALLLGIIQGLTEFLPVSSSGHLVIAQSLFGISGPVLLFDVFLHLGTLIATVVVFHRRIVKLLKALPRLTLFSQRWFQKGHLAIGDDPDCWLLILILCSTSITGAIGVLFHDFFEKTFSSPIVNSLTLLLTGILLFLTRNMNPLKGKTEIRSTLKDASLVGLAQGLAILPGLSRSGSTISTGLFLGFSREFAGEYSFLISIPAILGAITLEMSKTSFSNVPWAPMLIGLGASLIVGYISLRLLIGWIKAGKLGYFSYYCIAIGLLSLGLAF